MRLLPRNEIESQGLLLDSGDGPSSITGLWKGCRPSDHCPDRCQALANIVTDVTRPVCPEALPYNGNGRVAVIDHGGSGPSLGARLSHCVTLIRRLGSVYVQRKGLADFA